MNLEPNLGEGLAINQLCNPLLKSKQLYPNFCWNLTHVCIEICHLESAKIGSLFYLPLFLTLQHAEKFTGKLIDEVNITKFDNGFCCNIKLYHGTQEVNIFNVIHWH